MKVGILKISIYLPGCNSLKEKRGVLKRVLNLIRKRYNVSAVELDHNDVWRNSVIAVSAVCNSQKVIDNTFDGIIKKIDTFSNIQLLHYEIETL